MFRLFAFFALLACGGAQALTADQAARALL